MERSLNKIYMNGASTDQIIATVNNRPSGALSYNKNINPDDKE